MTALTKQAREVDVLAWVADPGEWQLVSPRVRCDSITEALGPNLPHAALSLVTGWVTGTPPVVYRADHETLLAPGDRVLVKFADVGETPGEVLSEGYVTGPTVTIETRGEGVSWSAASAGCLMAEAYPVGSWTRAYDNFAAGEPSPTGRTLCSGLVPVFNPKGRPNASKVLFNDGAADVCPLFAPEDDDALSEPWTYASAIAYCIEHFYAESDSATQALLDEWTFPTYAELAAVEELTGQPRDFKLEGRSWWMNVCELAREAGCRVRFSTGGDLDAGVTHTLSVFAIGDGAQKTIKLQAVGSRLDPDLSHAERIQFSRDASDLVNEPVCLGGLKAYEGTWPLVPGWLAGLLADPPDPPSDEYKGHFVRSQDQDADYRDAARLWILNEFGQATGEAYGEQPEFDLSSAVPGAAWARRPRPFTLPLAFQDTHKNSWMPCLVQATYDAGAHWHDLVGIGYDFLKDGAGIRLTVHAPHEIPIPASSDASSTYANYWEIITSADAADVALRIIATLQSDSRLTQAPEPPAGCPVARVTRFPYDRPSFLLQDQIAAGDYASQFAGYGSDERDDTAALAAEAAAIQAETALVRQSGSASLVDVEHSYSPGDVITKIEGREISFCISGTMTPARYVEVVSVTRVFGRVYRTELVLEDYRAAVSP